LAGAVTTVVQGAIISLNCNIGSSGFFIRLFWSSWKFLRVPRSTLELLGVPWSSLEFLETPKSSLVLHEVLGSSWSYSKLFWELLGSLKSSTVLGHLGSSSEFSYQALKLL